MKERPVLFSGPMVRALLEGRKTQTRRVVKARPGWPIGFVGGAGDQNDPRCYGFEDLNTAQWWTLQADGRSDNHQIPCPYGARGDRLWVRESFAFTDAHSGPYDASIEFRADNRCYAIQSLHLVDVPHGCDPRPFAGPWKPSIHMPRWASRITLEITGVRVERLNDISEADAANEGLYRLPASGRYVVQKGEQYFGGADRDARVVFADLWDRINGGGAWDANPWVWVVEFKRIEATGDKA